MSKPEPVAHVPNSLGTILCDVAGTLIGKGINQQLINLLNKMAEQGFSVQLITGAVDMNTFNDGGSMCHYAFLRDAGGLNIQILDAAKGKKGITSATYTDVVAIIDDNLLEGYIAEVKKGNPDLKLLNPQSHDSVRAALEGIAATRLCRQ